MSGKTLIKLLKKNGWQKDRIKGSHHIYTKDGVPVSIPVHGNEDIPEGTLQKLLKQTGLKLGNDR